MKRIIALLCLAGCGPVAPNELTSDETATEARAIVNGNVRNEVTFGGALVEASISGAATTCSGFFVAKDLVITHARCLDATRVWVGGNKYSVKLGRRAGFNPELAAIQLRQPVPGVTITRGTSRRVASGETLDCFGFDAQRTFTSGTFRVTDLSGELIFLSGGVGFGGPFGVDRSDDGGFCVRDSSLEVVAVLSSRSGVSPRAVQADTMANWLTDVLVAVAQSRLHSSLTLVNNPNVATPLALTRSGTSVVSLPRTPASLSQAFYLAEVFSNRPELVVLVNAETGLCVSAQSPVPGFPPLASLVRCNFASSNQWFVLTSHPNAFVGNLTTGSRLESPANVGMCLTPGSGTLLVDCARPPATFGFWLNLF